MLKPKKINLEKTEKLLAKGKWNYVLWQGVIVWGVMTAMLIALMEYFINGKPFFEGLPKLLIIFSIMGIFFGLFMWGKINKEYIKLKSDPKDV